MSDERPLVIWLDIETTGLCPDTHQCVEVGLVPTIGGVVRHDLAAECYVDHPSLTFDPDTLRLFGDRLRDRRAGVPVARAADLDEWLRDRLNRCADAVGVHCGQKPLTAGGKNFGSFDLAFLKRLAPAACRRLRHRCLDVGTLMHRPADPHLPDLAECRRRAGLPDGVAHTSMADAAACAEVYAIWCGRQAEQAQRRAA